MSKILYKLDSELQLIYKQYINLQKLGKKNMGWIHPCLIDDIPIPIKIITNLSYESLEKYGFKQTGKPGEAELSGTIGIDNLESIASLKEVQFLKFDGEKAEIPWEQKVDSRTKLILKKSGIPKYEAQTANRPGELELLGALLQFRDSHDFLIELGCQVNSIIGNMVTVKIPLNKLETVIDHPNVVRIEVSGNYSPDLDESIEHIHADGIRNGSPPFGGANKFTGSGVIVGVIDSGFLFSHKVFRDTDDESKSRILFLMDQTLEPEGGESAPTNAVGDPMTGVEYSQAEIEAAIAASDPMTVVRQEPGGHGTHVAGIAAGNGAQSGNCHLSFHYVGVAPEADLILVRLKSGSNELGTSDNLIDAISYIMRKAEDAGKPAVINISQGDNLGPHDGTSLVEEMIDLYLLIGNTKGFTIVKSAGNLRNKKRHAKIDIPANNALPVALKFEVTPPADDDDTTKIEIDIWYEGSNDIDIEIVPPNDNFTGTNTASPGDDVSFTEDTKDSTISVDSQTTQTNGRKRIFIVIRPDTDDHNLPGEWVLNLTNTSGTVAQVHAYIERDQLATFTTFVTESGTISTPGTSEEVITVGNYVSKGKNSGHIYVSSSRGPTADNRRKPDISAPGTDIISARYDPDAKSCCDCCYDFYISKNGTSMSAPHVAGAIALMFEKNPDLDHDSIKEALMNTADKDSFTGPTANNDFGEGKLNVQRALDAIPAGITMIAAVTYNDSIRFNTFKSQQTLFAKGSPLARLVESSRGNELHNLAIQHYREVRDLVNTNKRMATVWHRNKGPLLVHHLNRASMLPFVKVPVVIEGIPVVDLLHNIVVSLKKYSGIETSFALDKAMSEMPFLLGSTFNEFVSSYEETVDQP